MAGSGIALRCWTSQAGGEGSRGGAGSPQLDRTILNLTPAGPRVTLTEHWAPETALEATLTVARSLPAHQTVSASADRLSLPQRSQEAFHFVSARQV